MRPESVDTHWQYLLRSLPTPREQDADRMWPFTDSYPEVPLAQTGDWYDYIIVGEQRRQVLARASYVPKFRVSDQSCLYHART